MPKVNPDILRWARETAGLSPDEAVKKLDIKEARGVPPLERLEALEQGEVAPTRATLVKMAKHYRRPLLTFYLSERPRRGDRGKDFRTLPDTVDLTDTALVDVVIRNIRARQSIVRNMLADEDEAEPIPFIGSRDMKDGVGVVVRSIRESLSFDLQVYYQKRTIDEAFAYLRGRSEEAGVFVLLVDNLGSYHTTISVEAFRGFALADNVAPFIAINANDSKGAWCFTLVHELAHLWLGATGVSGFATEMRIEQFCNDVASEFLVPKSEIGAFQIGAQTDLEGNKNLISAFAARRNVSSTMIAYKLYRADVLTYDAFERLKSAYRKDFLKNKQSERIKNREKEGGPTYQILRKHRAGTALIRLVERMMYSGALTTTKAGLVLGVRAKNVQGLVEAARPRHAV